MSKLRVLEVAKSTGGLGTYMRWLAKGVDQARFELTFACLSEGSSQLASELKDKYGAQALHWPMNRFKVDVLGDARVIYHLARLIRRERFDLVHGHGSKAGFMIRMAAIGTSTKTAYSPHGFAFHARQKPFLARLYAFIENLAVRFLTTRIITVSHGERTEAEQWGIPTNQKFITVHSGIELDQFGRSVDRAQIFAGLKLPEEARLVGTVGRLDEQKAPLDFVRVAALVRAELPQVYFIWVGEGHLLADAQALAAELNVLDGIIFAGQRGDVPQLLAALDCFILTSHWEAFPIVILEAMASRLPIVATALAGTQEALAHENDGWIAPVGDISAFSAAVVKILSDPALAQRLGTNARERIEHEFTRAIMMENLMDVYQNMIADRGAS